MEQKRVFFCYKCNELYYSSIKAKCPRCKTDLSDLNVKVEEWESFADEEHNEILKKNMPLKNNENSENEKPESKTYPVRFCLFCKKAFKDGETECPRCRGALVETKYTSEYWNNCNDDERKKHIEEYIYTTQDNRESITEAGEKLTTTEYQEVSSVAKTIKALSVIVLFLCTIGSFIIMSEVGFPVGFATLLVCLLMGMLAYGIGEICEQITQINNKLKK